MDGLIAQHQLDSCHLWMPTDAATSMQHAAGAMTLLIQLEISFETWRNLRKGKKPQLTC